MNVGPSLLIPTTHLTSRGVPALFNNLTTACTPLTSSNVRSAADESTSTQSKVSRIAEERWAIGGVLSDGGLGIEPPADDSVIMGVCREVVKSATRIYNAAQHKDETSIVVPYLQRIPTTKVYFTGCVMQGNPLYHRQQLVQLGANHVEFGLSIFCIVGLISGTDCMFS